MTLPGPYLALDSSTTTGSVAVGDERGLLAEVVLNVAGVHSAALLPAAEQAVRSAGLTPSDLRSVVVGAGPGSFTGLRIAAATAKGIVRALEIPMLAYPSLLAAAVSGWAGGGPVCALFDARKRDVFAAVYRWERLSLEVELEVREPQTPTPNSTYSVLLPPEALTLDELLERPELDHPMLFVGDAAVRHREELERRAGARVMPAELGLPRASHLLWLAARAPELGRVEDPGGWEPDYLRAAGVERIAAARAAAGGGDA